MFLRVVVLCAIAVTVFSQNVEDSTNATFVELIFPTIAPTVESNTELPNASAIPETLRCQFQNGTLWGLATSCSDININCGQIFNETIEGYVRPVRCYDDNFAAAVAFCPKTCATCCEQPGYQCQDDPLSPINCSNNARFCKNPQWSLIMMSYCQKTCAYCG